MSDSQFDGKCSNNGQALPVKTDSHSKSHVDESLGNLEQKHIRTARNDKSSCDHRLNSHDSLSTTPFKSLSSGKKSPDRVKRHRKSSRLNKKLSFLNNEDEEDDDDDGSYSEDSVEKFSRISSNASRRTGHDEKKVKKSNQEVTKLDDGSKKHKTTPRLSRSPEIERKSRERNLLDIEADASSTSSCSCEDHSNSRASSSGIVINKSQDVHEDLDYDDGDEDLNSKNGRSISRTSKGTESLNGQSHENKNDRSNRFDSVSNSNCEKEKKKQVQNLEEGELSDGDKGNGNLDASNSLIKTRTSYKTMLRSFLTDACFFLMKSINHDNIDISKRRGVWATLKQNELKLNKAFRQYKNVILIFSVQQSGKFQGFARMLQEASYNGEVVRWVLPRRLSNTSLGGIIKIDWICTRELAFEETAHLKNRYNEDKPVKVGRDGQLLESAVGKKLCKLFPNDTPDRVISCHRNMQAHLSQLKQRSNLNSNANNSQETVYNNHATEIHHSNHRTAASHKFRNSDSRVFRKQQSSNPSIHPMNYHSDRYRRYEEPSNYDDFLNDRPRHPVHQAYLNLEQPVYYLNNDQYPPYFNGMASYQQEDQFYHHQPYDSFYHHPFHPRPHPSQLGTRSYGYPRYISSPQYNQHQHLSALQRLDRPPPTSSANNFERNNNTAYNKSYHQLSSSYQEKSGRISHHAGKSRQLPYKKIRRDTSYKSGPSSLVLVPKKAVEAVANVTHLESLSSSESDSLPKSFKKNANKFTSGKTLQSSMSKVRETD